jgi:hypothetical protein
MLVSQHDAAVADRQLGVHHLAVGSSMRLFTSAERTRVKVDGRRRALNRWAVMVCMFCGLDFSMEDSFLCSPC